MPWPCIALYNKVEKAQFNQVEKEVILTSMGFLLSSGVSRFVCLPWPLLASSRNTTVRSCRTDSLFSLFPSDFSQVAAAKLEEGRDSPEEDGGGTGRLPTGRNRLRRAPSKMKKNMAEGRKKRPPPSSGPSGKNSKKRKVSGNFCVWIFLWVYFCL